MKFNFLIVALTTVVLLNACSKDDNNNDSGIKTIRYQFTTTDTGNYGVLALADTSVIFSDNVNSLSWSKTITVTGSDSAYLTVFPPPEWANTPREADVNLKIFVNDSEKASASGHFIGLDRPNGIKISTSY
ncbi:MAG: hypothetical protein ABI402_08310 [Ferruginibacter sp.]